MCARACVCGGYHHAAKPAPPGPCTTTPTTVPRPPHPTRGSAVCVCGRRAAVCVCVGGWGVNTRWLTAPHRKRVFGLLHVAPGAAVVRLLVRFLAQVPQAAAGQEKRRTGRGGERGCVHPLRGGSGVGSGEARHASKETYPDPYPSPYQLPEAQGRRAEHTHLTPVATTVNPWMYCMMVTSTCSRISGV